MPDAYAEQADADFAKAYLTYVLSAEGQDFAHNEAGNAPLSEKLQGDAAAIVRRSPVTADPEVSRRGRGDALVPSAATTGQWDQSAWKDNR